MTTAGTYEIDVQDLEYLRHGDSPLLARMFKPRGDGPFPLVIELHGGAWCRDDRTSDSMINEPVAGKVVWGGPHGGGCRRWLLASSIRGNTPVPATFVPSVVPPVGAAAGSWSKRRLKCPVKSGMSSSSTASVPRSARRVACTPTPAPTTW